MHMPAGRLIKHQLTQRCNSNTQIWGRRRDVAISGQFAEASFRLTGGEEAEFFEGLETFKYLGRMLDRLYDNWTAVRQNIRKSHQFYILQGKLINREGVEPLVSVIFYQAVVQEVLLFGSDI